MEHVQILIVIACILLLNQAQIEAEILLMLCLILRRLILRNQVTLLASKHCRQQRRRGLDRFCRRRPIFLYDHHFGFDSTV